MVAYQSNFRFVWRRHVFGEVDFRALTHTRCRVAAEESKETVRFGNSLEYLV